MYAELQKQQEALLTALNKAIKAEVATVRWIQIYITKVVPNYTELP